MIKAFVAYDFPAGGLSVPARGERNILSAAGRPVPQPGLDSA